MGRYMWHSLQADVLETESKQKGLTSPAEPRLTDFPEVAKHTLGLQRLGAVALARLPYPLKVNRSVLMEAISELMVRRDWQVPRRRKPTFLYEEAARLKSYWSALARALKVTCSGSLGNSRQRFPAMTCGAQCTICGTHAL